MRKQHILCLGFCVMALCFLMTACGSGAEEESVPDEPAAIAESEVAEENTEEEVMNPTLLYQGHGSVRIVTGEDKVIYVDPFAGEGYDLTADLILETHGHYDHVQTDLIASRAEDCRTITYNEALTEKNYDLGYVQVEAVQAGNNKNHSIDECVGFVLTFSNGKKVYLSGDTSKTDQMAEMADMNIDYAFFCCDGIYNMDLEEAAECARLVGAKHNIPYHIVDAKDASHFSMERAEQFDAPNKLILQPGEELTIE